MKEKKANICLLVLAVGLGMILSLLSFNFIPAQASQIRPEKPVMATPLPGQAGAIPGKNPTQTPGPFPSSGALDSSPLLTTTATVTVTVTLTPTITVTPTVTVTPTATVTPTVTPETPSWIYLPFVSPEFSTGSPEVYSVLYCDHIAQPLSIPDEDPSGVDNVISIVSNQRSLRPGNASLSSNDGILPPYARILHLKVFLDINHDWVGDLAVRLTHRETGRSVQLIDRPGVPDSHDGCSSDNIQAILADEGSQPAERKCASSPAAISGMYSPVEPLNNLNEEYIEGDWVLNAADLYPYNSGSLNHWCMEAQVSQILPPPMPTPPPPELPSQAYISGVHGVNQAMHLDCEIRSAVDWATFWGHSINEYEFFDRLPVSDNPDEGFVGNVNGIWGQIPPNDYGVHAVPIAEMLRNYGLNAYAHRPLSWEALKSEIAAGRPVIVWIIGTVYNGLPSYYTALDGLFTVVAPQEHTMMVIGYTEDTVTLVDGYSIRTRSVNQFLDSWSVLGNMAVTASP